MVNYAGVLIRILFKNTMPITIRKADLNDQKVIWEILKNGIAKRRNEGSTQWQNGYPNPNVVHEDILKDRSFIIEKNREVIACAVIDFGGEEAYLSLNNWQYNGVYATIHRIAIHPNYLGQGYGVTLLKTMEEFIKYQGIKAIRLDTNFDNYSTLSILKKLAYIERGNVYYGTEERIAFEKVIDF